MKAEIADKPEGRLIEDGYGWAVTVRDAFHDYRRFLVTEGHDPRVAKQEAEIKWPHLDIIRLVPLGYGQVRKVEVDQWFPSSP